MAECRVHLSVGGENHSATYVVKLGIMTVRLGRASKQRRVGRMHRRVLARLLLHQLLRAMAARRHATA